MSRVRSHTRRVNGRRVQVRQHWRRVGTAAAVGGGVALGIGAGLLLLAGWLIDTAVKGGRRYARWLRTKPVKRAKRRVRKWTKGREHYRSRAGTMRRYEKKGH